MTNRVLSIVFAALFFLNVGYVVLGLASIPGFYERVTTLMVPTYSVAGQELVSNTLVEEEAASRGVSLAQYAIQEIVFSTVYVLLFVVVAGLIAWRAGTNWFAWYSAFLLVFIAESTFTAQILAARLLPPQVFEAAAILWPLVLLYLYLFPNGKPVPLIGLLVMGPLVLAHFLFQASYTLMVFVPIPEYAELVNELIWLWDIVIPLAFITALICQVYRYFRVSTPVEKQQTKWFLFGLVLLVAVGFPLAEVFAASPYLEKLDILPFVFLPLAVSISILKYRLWDIDVIIRRTLTYALVTALLLSVFFGSVILLQQLFAGITGSGQNEIVTVLSTLAIAALFVPVRNWIQNTIDKRFNRPKYNAQQVLNDFATTVRDETDLEKLTARLMQVVDETMQPKSVSVWLKMDKSKRPSTQE